MALLYMAPLQPRGIGGEGRLARLVALLYMACPSNSHRSTQHATPSTSRCRVTCHVRNVVLYCSMLHEKYV